MHFELPAPSMVFDVALEDGAKIRMRRHGNPDGVRLLLTHGNGFGRRRLLPVLAASPAKLRSLGVRLPQSRAEPAGGAVASHLPATHPRSRTRRARGEIAARCAADRRPVSLDVGAHGDEARRRGRLALGYAGVVRSAERAAAGPSGLCRNGGVRERDLPNGRGSAAGASPRSRNWRKNTGRRGPRCAGSTARTN